MLQHNGVLAQAKLNLFVSPAVKAAVQLFQRFWYIWQPALRCVAINPHFPRADVKIQCLQLRQAMQIGKQC